MPCHESNAPAAALAGLLFLLLPPSVTNAGSGRLIAIPDLPDLKDRVTAFRQALREVTVEPRAPEVMTVRSGNDILFLESSFRFTDQLERPSLNEPPGLPGRRDLVFEEQWLIAGREDDHERAARHWLGRRLKGSDSRVRKGNSVLKPKLAWDHGLLFGVGHGPFSVRAGSGQWRLQWSKRWARSSGPWRGRVSVGEEDGEFKASFLFGRTLLDSYGR